MWQVDVCVEALLREVAEMAGPPQWVIGPGAVPMYHAPGLIAKSVQLTLRSLEMPASLRRVGACETQKSELVTC